MENGLDIEQERVFKSLAELGGLVEEELDILLDKFISNSGNLDKVVMYSFQIKARSRDIESECLKVLLRHHPVARDLRIISAATRISTDLERIGDNAGDIAEIIPFISHFAFFENLRLAKMATTVREMVTGAIDAFISADVGKANDIILSDDVVDEAFVFAKRGISRIIKNGDENAEEAPDLLMIAKYLERMGDHAVSLARYVGWSVDGNEYWLTGDGSLK